MSPRQFVRTIREAAPGAPRRLTDELVTSRLAILDGWLVRVRRNRALYDRGELAYDGPGRGRMAAFASTPMMAHEQRAAFELYAAAAALLAGAARRLHASIPGHGEPLEDVLFGQLWEAYCLALSTYDPERGASLAGWLALNVGQILGSHLTALARSRLDPTGEAPLSLHDRVVADDEDLTILDTVPAPAELDEPDYAEAAWAIAKGDPLLESVARLLFESVGVPLPQDGPEETKVAVSALSE